MSSRRPDHRVLLATVLTALIALLLGTPGSAPATAAPADTAAPAPAAPAATAKAAAAPTPDLLDIAFTGGAAVDTARQVPAITYGAPVFGTDADQGETMTVDGVDDAVGFDIADVWPDLAEGFTLECVFKLTAPLPTSREMDLCSDKEAGGLSLYVTGSNLGTMAHIGGGYKRTEVAIDTGRWYHAAASWDGAALQLYVNGQPAGTVAATGALLPPPEPRAQRLIVGADANNTSIGQPAPPGTVFAAAGLFGRALPGEEILALAEQWDTAVPTPAADVFDVDFADGTPKEKVSGLTFRTFGKPVIAQDSALRRNVADFPGGAAYGYRFDDQWSRLSKSASIECTFRYTGTLPTGAENAICSGKEAGGLSIYLNGDQIGLMAHIGGGYKTARTPIRAQQWYHVVGTWNGQEITLYVDGEPAATTPASGALGLPNATARAWTLGADSANNGNAQFYAKAKVAAARIYSTALSAADVRALDIAAFGEHPDAGVRILSTTPAPGDHLSEPVALAVETANAANATGWSYLLDGEEIAPGDQVGPGLAAGDHNLVITATDVFGKEIVHEVAFTSDAIPTGGGTDDEQGTGSVRLSAIATSPDGSDVTTTFTKATATSADGGVAGVVTALPTTREFAYTERADVDGLQLPDDDKDAQSPSSGDIPFQRYDVAVPAFTPGQQVVWKGQVDPARSVSLRAWDEAAGIWRELGASRGAPDADTSVQGMLSAGLITDGVVRLMVAGIDPFADDLSPRDERAQADKDRFEDAENVDFSFAHFTDTQYIAEGAAGGTYNDFDGVVEPADAMKEAERALWASAYQRTTEWIRDNAGPRKIAYAGHTGDIIENDYHDPLSTDAAGNLLYPGLDEQVTAEFDFTSGAHDALDSGALVNQVVAGNHDNQLGREIGPQARFNSWYGPERYYTAAKSWPNGASYHAWDETQDSAGNTVTPGADNQNNYVLFSAGGLDFVSVGLSYGVTEEEARWASETFARFPDRNGILITHAYLAPSSAPDGRGANFSADGSRLYDMVVEANPNVFLVLGGHEHGVGTNLKTGDSVTVAHDVVELLADYQFYKVTAGELWPDKVDAAGNIDLDGDGVADKKKGDRLQFGASWLRLLQFDVERSEMSIDTYSPLFDNFGATEYDDRFRYNGSEDNLTLPVDLSSRTTTFSTDGLTVVTPTDEVIGEATARSGWPASVTWRGLTPGQVYAWTATSRNASGERVGSVRQFGTVFRAIAAGTDTAPPRLTVPAVSTLDVGQAFDPMAGVTATDDNDGDLTGSVTVSGAVDTSRAGSYPMTYVVADGNGNQAVASRVVNVVAPRDDRVATTVASGNVAARFGDPLQLTATVTPAITGGTLRFLNGEEVLCESPVVGGRATCSVPMLPPPGDYVLTAAYGGNAEHLPSQKSSVLTVGQPTQAPPTQTPTQPGEGTKDARLKVKAVKVKGPDGSGTAGAGAASDAEKRGGIRYELRARLAKAATGRVVLRSGGERLCRARIDGGRAECIRRLEPGRYRIVATYAGDETFAADKVRLRFRVR